MNTRIQFEMSEARVKDLENLMGEAGIVTRRDLFNNALALFEWAVKEVRSGRVVASIDETGRNYKELVMPALVSVATANGVSVRVEPRSLPKKEEAKAELVFASAK